MKKLLLFIMAFVIMANMAFAAVDIAITPVKAAFNEGDRLEFDYSITSSISQNIVFIPHISCPSMLVGVKHQERAMLGAGVPYRGRHYGAVVETDTEPQECTASIEITSPEPASKKTKLQIRTLPSFDFSMVSCRDSACTKQQRNFVKGSTIYLKADSKVSPSASASVIFPDRTRRTIALPGSFVASQSGEYWLEYTAAKSGYKQAKGTASIFVIEKAFTVPYAEFSVKRGQAVVRPVFKAPSAVSANKVLDTKALTKKTFLRNMFSRITGYFALLF